LVAGYYRPRNSILIIEQPEMRLHPNAEAEIGTFLSDVIKNGIQLFVETHSVHLILRLQTHIAAKDILPDEVNVYYIYHDVDASTRLIKRMPIGEDGYFTVDWPKGFFTERLEESKKLAKLAAGK